MRPLARPGCVLAGDAAAVLDPAAGQGVLFALWSGTNAARAILACLREPALSPLHLARYDDWVMRETERKVNGLRTLYEGLGITVATLDR